MNDQAKQKHTTDMRRLVREAYCGGYQQAIDVLRRWHEKFGTDQSRREFQAAIDMVEAAKPSPEVQDV